MFQYEKAWQAVGARVDKALRAAGRPAGSARLVAVSKTFPPPAVRAVHGLGQRAFGENYVQEAVAKMDALADLDGIEWHLIGPLQSNKTRAAAERFDWVHTIDRVRIAERLALARPAGMPPLNVCVQVNISGEATKSVMPDQLTLGITVTGNGTTVADSQSDAAAKVAAAKAALVAQGVSESDIQTSSYYTSPVYNGSCYNCYPRPIYYGSGSGAAPGAGHRRKLLRHLSGRH